MPGRQGEARAAYPGLRRAGNCEQRARGGELADGGCGAGRPRL